MNSFDGRWLGGPTKKKHKNVRFVLFSRRRRRGESRDQKGRSLEFGRDASLEALGLFDVCQILDEEVLWARVRNDETVVLEEWRRSRDVQDSVEGAAVPEARGVEVGAVHL